LSDTGADGAGLLIDHLDAARVSVVIQVMLNVAPAEARFQPEPAPAVCFQRTFDSTVVELMLGSGV